jgi:hypothetical protein
MMTKIRQKGSTMPQPFRNLTEALRVSLTPQERDAIVAIAESNDRSMSWVLRQAVVAYLNTRVPPAKTP